MIKKTIYIIKTLFRIILSSFSNPKKFFLNLELSISTSSFTPKIKFSKVKDVTLCGIENDNTFEKILGLQEPHFDNLVENILHSEDNVIDLGANIGSHSIFMSKIIKKGQIYAFEPQSLIFSILQNNLLYNNCHNVIAYQFAITDKNNDIKKMQPTFFNSDKNIHTGAKTIELNNIGTDILTKTLDSINLKKIAFIKIDIQGSELLALKGAKELIKENNPIIFIEIEEQYLRSLKTSTKELIDLIFSYDYSLYQIKNEYPCDHICIPNNKIKDFEFNILPKLNFKVSKKITKGRDGNIKVIFANKDDQIYEKLIIS